MKYDKFTSKMQEAIVGAQDLAGEEHHQVIEPEHLTLTLLNQSDSFVPEILKKLGITISSLKDELKKSIKKYPLVSGSQPYLSINFKKLIDLTVKISEELKDKFVSTEHALMALTELENTESFRILNKKFNITKDKIISTLVSVRGNQNVDSENPEEKANVLKKYSINLTDLASQGKLDPVIGRDEEVRRVIQVLSRRTKNNPVLIGEPGVGKTAIVEGLAQKIWEGNVPESLKHKKVLSLSVGSLVAGAMYRGQFEERVKAILKEISESKGDIILFIDEIHTLVGAGRTDGAIDASNMFKPALARGDLRCVGATTLNEYRKYIEKDTALERRFQKVFVKEPDELESIAILRGLKEKYEIHHGIKISDEAIISAVRLSARYITDRFLPDKAIDLMDEAASKLKMEVESMPHDIEDRIRKITRLEVEASAVKHDSSENSKIRLKEIEKEISSLKIETDKLKLKWQNEKNTIGDTTSIKEELEKNRLKLLAAEKEGQYEDAGKLKYSIIPELEKKLDLNNKNNEKKFLRDTIDETDIAKVVSTWTGIPAHEMLQSEKEKLLKMDEVLKGKIIGQDHAIELISNAIRRSRSGLKNPNSPIGSFIFMGPTGVGKTETARQLAGFLFNDLNALVRIDMSEYMESHNVSRLIGAPPGYIGHDEGGQLTEAIRRRPYSIVLFDEMEKAHPEVFNILLQILDDGHLTDSHGKRIDFKNTIIIMTSNVGSDIILEKGNLLQDEALELLHSRFKPEFLNRIDDIVVFNNLSNDNLKDIVNLELRKLEKLIEDKKISLKISDKAKDKILELGFDPSFGARPIKRAIQKYITNELSKKLIEEKLKNWHTINIDHNGVAFSFS